MYKLNEKQNIMLEKINRFQRRSLDLSKISRKSSSNQKHSKNSEHSGIKIQKIKDFIIESENINNKNDKNKKDSISFKGTNFPTCLSFMTNTKNYINSIDKKFRVRNLKNLGEYKTMNDNSSLLLGNNSLLNSNKEVKNKKLKNIFYLKSLNNKKSVRQLMSKINFSTNNKNSKKNFFDENNINNNSSSSVNIKNYNYFISSIDKSVNIFEQKHPQNYKNSGTILTNFKLNLNKKKLNHFFNKKINLSMNTSTGMDIKNKETTLNESIKDKNFNKKKSKIFIEVKENKNENKEKKNQIRDEGGGTAELLKKLENIDNTIIKRNKKFFKKLSMASFDKTEDKKEEKDKEQKKEENKKDNKEEEEEKEEEKEEKKEEKKDKEEEKKEEKKEDNKDDNKEDNNDNNKEDNKEEKKEIKDEQKKSNLVNNNNKEKRNLHRKSILIIQNFEKKRLSKNLKNNQQKKEKYPDLFIQKSHKILDNETNEFLKEIIEDNDIILPQSKKIKANKRSIILNQKNNINKSILKEKEKLKYISTYLFIKSININTLNSLRKSIMFEVYKEKILNYKTALRNIKETHMLNILVYSYISSINKCDLDNNLKNFFYQKLDFSSINLPKVDINENDNENPNDNNILNDSILSKKILQKEKTENNDKKDVFFTVKTKFIENKKYRYNKLAQILSLHFIKKELDFYNVLENVNFLDNDDNLNLNKENNNSPMIKKSIILKRKRTNSFINDKLVRYNNRNKSIKHLTSNQNTLSLSVLQKKEFFSKQKNILYKKFRNSLKVNLFWYKISGKNSKNLLQKSPANMDFSAQQEYQLMNQIISLIQSHNFNRDLSYNNYDMLKKIKKKKNMELILRLFIIEGESLLFSQFFKDVIKKIDINSKDDEGNTFLILSVKYGINSISKSLLEHGVDANIQNYEGNSALHYALSRKNFYMADLLKKFGAVEDIINMKGFTPWESLGKSVEKID